MNGHPRNMIKFLTNLIRHQLLWIIVSRLAVSAAGLLAGIVLARTLGPAGLGAYANLLASAAIIGTFLCLGTEVPYNLRAARSSTEGVGLLRLIGIHAILSLPITLVAWVGMGWLSPAARPSWLLIPTVAAFILYQLTFPVMSGWQRQKIANVIAALLLLLHASLVLAFSRTGTNLLPIALMSYIGSLAGLYAAALVLGSSPPERKLSYGATALSLLQEGRAFLLATAFGVIRMRANVALLGWYRPSIEIGNYQIMQTFMEVLFLIPVTVSTYLLSSGADGRTLLREARATTMASCAITALMAAAIALALPWIIPGLYGEGFQDAVALGPLMLSSALAFAITKGIAAYLAKIGHAALIARLELGTTCVFLTATIILIRQWGLVGAVYSFMAAAWLSAGLHLLCVVRVLRQSKE